MRQRTIQIQLFISYSLLLIVFIMATTVFFYFSFAGTLKKRAFESLSQLSTAVLNSLDNEIEQMDEISKRIAYSNLLKDRFLNYLTDPTEVNLYHNQTALRDIFIAIMGPLEKWYQINLYDFEGHVVGAGISNSIFNRDAAKEPWFESTVAAEGDKVISLQSPDLLELKGEEKITLTRVYFNNFYQAVGVIEVQYALQYIFNAVDDFTYSGDAQKDKLIYVFGPEGELIFPFDLPGSKESDSIFNKALASEAESGLFYINTADSRESLIMTSIKSDFTDWHIIVADKERTLLAPVRIFTRMMLIFCLVAVAASLFSSFAVANRLSNPIKQLEKTASSLTLDVFPEQLITEIDGCCVEIASLQSSFKDMHLRLQRSAEETASAKTRELESRMLALQAKMNPHFLYNTISTIDVLADEQSFLEIKKICQDLSNMLRYISQGDTGDVCLRDEVLQTEKFLNLMKHRYEENIVSNISIPDEMLDIEVPRLILQPFVENSLKYGIGTDPPWKISVKGSYDAEKWEVEIIDSGQGFSRDVLNRLNQELGMLDVLKPISGNALKGIGILNIYARLKLLYKEQLIFKIANAESGGARIVIGGLH